MADQSEEMGFVEWGSLKETAAKMFQAEFEMRVF